MYDQSDKMKTIEGQHQYEDSVQGKCDQLCQMLKKIGKASIDMIDSEKVLVTGNQFTYTSIQI